MRADEDLLRARGDEAVDELLGRRAVDQRGLVGAALEPVERAGRDVGVEPVLVRGVAEPAVARAERAAVRPREVPDPDARRAGVRGAVLVRSRVSRVRMSRSVPQRRQRAVRRLQVDRVPGEEVRAPRRQLHAVDEAPAEGRPSAREGRQLRSAGRARRRGRGVEPRDRDGGAGTGSRGIAAAAGGASRIPDGERPTRRRTRTSWQARQRPASAARASRRTRARPRGSPRSGSTPRAAPPARLDRRVEPPSAASSSPITRLLPRSESGALAAIPAASSTPRAATSSGGTTSLTSPHASAVRARRRCAR